MPSRPHEPRLNRFPYLRYDNGHADGDTPTNSLPPYPADSQTGSADMEVNGPGSVHGTTPIHSVPSAHEVAQPADPIAGSRHVDTARGHATATPANWASCKEELEAVD